MKRKLSPILLFAFVLFGAQCSQKAETPAFDVLMKKKPYTAVMFFAPDCPLCMTFAKPFNELMDAYGNDVQFLAVQSGMNYEAMEIKMYKEETGLKAPIFIDQDYAVAHRFNASVTPEFVLLDSTGKIYYQGLLDDRMKALGVYKQHWNNHYLAQALSAVHQGLEIPVKQTVPIGCDLEY